MTNPKLRYLLLLVGWLAAGLNSASGATGPLVLLNCRETAGNVAADSAGAIADSAHLQSVGHSSAGGRPSLAFTPAQRSFGTIAASAEANPFFKFTYAFWLRPTAWSEGQTVFSRASSDPRRAACRLHFRSQWLWFEVDGSTFHLTPPPPGAWTHVALTFDGTAFRAYSNGILQNDYVFRAELPAVTAPLLLGTTDPAAAGSKFYAGQLGDFRLYDRALSALEICQLIGRNSPPSAVAFTRNTARNQALALTLSGSDADGIASSFQIVSPPSHGTLSGNLPAQTYKPAPAYTGGLQIRDDCLRRSDG